MSVYLVDLVVIVDGERWEFYSRKYALQYFFAMACHATKACVIS